MLKRNAQSMQVKMWLWVLLGVLVLSPLQRAAAQDTRALVPYPRDVLIETVDPESKMPRSSFCIGMNTLEVKLTNNTNARQYVYVVNRDTSGVARTLYRGWLEMGQTYLSTLMQSRLGLSGPAGTEALRVDIGSYDNNVTPGSWMTFYVQDCGSSYPPGGTVGSANLWAQVYPYAIAQGSKGTITLQTSVDGVQMGGYYVDILNSYGQLWKRLPLNKRAYQPYQVILPVGKTTKPAQLTYTANLWSQGNLGGNGQPQKIGTTSFSFRVVTAGATPTPYETGYTYPGNQSVPYASGYSWSPMMADPYGSMMSTQGMSYGQYVPYTMPYAAGSMPYDANYKMDGSASERAIE
jgi:hypothetical protein